MTAAILTVGTDVARGDASDACGEWLAARMSGLGFDVFERTVVPDDAEAVRRAVQRFVDACAVVVTVGGLLDGSVRSALGLGHAHDAAATALGSDGSFTLRAGRAQVVCLGADLAAVEHVFDGGALKHLIARARTPDRVAKLRIVGLAARDLGPRLRAVVPASVSVALHEAHTEATVTLRVPGAVPGAADLLTRTVDEVRARLGSAVFGEGDESFAAAVGKALRSRGRTLAVAESCTGGLIGSMLTAVPGSSEYLLLDAVTYSNVAKTRVLRVPSEVLLAHGAVSVECVRAMAAGARRLTDADLAVAVSGIAGPTGGTSEKPVGLVCFALEGEGVSLEQVIRFDGDRAAVQRQAAYHALSLVRDACAGPVTTTLPSVCG